MLKLERVPNGIEEIIDLYGAPGKVEGGRFLADGRWIKENLARFHFPFTLRESWAPYRPLRSFLAHKLVGAVMVDALQEIHDKYGAAYMERHGLDYWGGVFNPRLKRGSDEPSTHAWAAAIDVCPALGPFGELGRMPYQIVEAFLKRDFEWGGFWRIPDPQHFQACTSY